MTLRELHYYTDVAEFEASLKGSSSSSLDPDDPYTRAAEDAVLDPSLAL